MLVVSGASTALRALDAVVARRRAVAQQLVDLTSLAYGDGYRGMYPTVGGSDEFIRLFLHERDVTREFLTSLQGRLTGVAEEGEIITLQVGVAALPLRAE